MSEVEFAHKPAEEREVEWEPKENERTWYSHAVSGDRGYLCRRTGRDMIRLDRPNDPHAIMPFNPQQWIVDREHRPLTAMASTRIAYEADRLLCRALGDHGRAKKEWNMCTERIRLLWMREGPSKPEIRRTLYLAIRDALRPLED